MSIAAGQIALRARHAPLAILRETEQILRLSWEQRHMLWVVTWMDFQKRYAGSLLGMLWLPLYSAMFLGMYSFVYLFLFPQTMTGFTTYEIVLVIFAALVPYFVLTDVIGSSVTTVKSNIGVIKTSLFPAELLPVKQVLLSLLAGLMNLGIVLVMLAPTRLAGWHLLYLPVSLALTAVMCLAAGWLFATLGVMFPDIGQFINIITLALLFLSPIGVVLGSVNGFAYGLMLANPLTYLIDSFRFSLLGQRAIPWWTHAAVFIASFVVMAAAGAVFRRLKPMFVDYE